MVRDSTAAAFDHSAWSRLLALGRPFFASSARWQARGLFGTLVVLLLFVNGLDVINSYVGRNFMTAIAQRERARFLLFTLLYLLVFAGSSVVAVFHTFVQDRLALLWRDWLTRAFVHHYLSAGAHRYITARGAVDNPDQRISEDVRTFTTTLLALSMMFFNAILTTFAFAGVLWSISRWLVLSAVVYAVIGSTMTVLLGRRLIELQNLQLKKEADLRRGLMSVRERDALDAAGLGHRIGGQLRLVVGNAKDILGVTRNMGFFTSFYNYLIPILPIIIVAPSYMRGEVQLGVVTQAAMAFAQILGAFSVVVVQFPSLSSFAVVVRRLGSLWEEIQGASPASPGPVRLSDCP